MPYGCQSGLESSVDAARPCKGSYVVKMDDSVSCSLQTVSCKLLTNITVDKALEWSRLCYRHHFPPLSRVSLWRLRVTRDGCQRSNFQRNRKQFHAIGIPTTYNAASPGCLLRSIEFATRPGKPHLPCVTSLLPVWLVSLKILTQHGGSLPMTSTEVS